MILGGFNSGKTWIFPTFSAFLMFSSIACFLIVMGWSILFVFPPSSSVSVAEMNRNPDLNNNNGSVLEACNVFDGKWVIDESYPLYNASPRCPFVERGFNCLGNGRKDKEYMKWRWKPKSCEIPRFDPAAMLEWLRGKRVVFVGDSLSRTQWESMICMLMSGVTDKSSVHEVNGKPITKQIRHLCVRFESFNFTVEFYRSVFLVQPASPPLTPRQSPKRVKMVLKLDEIDSINTEWIDSDVLVFNSGHWWSNSKLFDMGWYFQFGGKIKLGMPIPQAFRLALSTWQSWLSNSSIDTRRTQVFFRTFESSHWSGGREKKCRVTKQPSLKNEVRRRSWISDAIVAAVKNASASFGVKLLHVTPMGAFRSDAHVGSWSDNPSSVPDCSHWCLPGVPDMWNEILFSVLSKNYIS